MGLPAVFPRYRGEIDREMRSVFPSSGTAMYDMLRYQLGWIDERGKPVNETSGKALRPTLCLLSYESISGSYEEALPAAAAIELIHNFSLIHDDVQDNDRKRRNRSSVWAIWGKPQAINAGDAMRILASASLIRLVERGMPGERMLRAARLLDETCLRLIEGQYLDISYESRLDVTTGDYLKMAEGKTAALISCSLEMGALLATEDQRLIHAFRGGGKNLGLAFQIKDDLLGIWGDGARLGKPVGADILRKKKTYPIVYTWEKANDLTRSMMVNVYRQETVDESGRDAILYALGDLQAKEQTQAMVDMYSERAWMEIVGFLPSPWAHDRFREVIDFLTKRDY
jgi:geranylgeranyl diphosphate synthase type I